MVMSLSATAADATAEVKSAAKKLASQANYSWTATTKLEGGNQNFRPGPIEGKTEKDGYTCFTGSIGDNSYSAAFKGTKWAFKGQDEWQSAAEMEGSDRGPFIARRMAAFKAPAAEAEDLAGKVKDLKKGEDGLFSGDLTAEGVKEMFSRFGRRNTEATDTKGWAKFWVKDGMLVKYEYNTQGKIAGQDNQEITINRTLTVEIKDVGTTKVNVPDEAKKKLS